MINPEHDVRRRRVFYIPGYDPFPPRRYRELYRKEANKQADISGYGIDVSARKGSGYGWHAVALIDGHATESDFEVLVWSDIVRDSMSGSIGATYWQLLRTAWTYFATGTLWRLMRLRKGPVIAALYPIMALTLQLAGAMVFAHFAGIAVGTLLHGAGRVTAGQTALPRWGEAVGYWGTYALVLVFVLRWFRARDSRLFAYYLMHDYAFSAQFCGAYPSALENRMAEFRETIRDALDDTVDEVLVVGHSSGAHIAISVLAGLLRENPELQRRPALSFLSLGHVVPMVSFLPGAHALRADLQFLSERDEIVWVDVTAPGDGCAFALCDPVAVTGVATSEKRWPLVFSAKFTHSLSPARWRMLRWRFFRLHFQYLCAFDAPKDYDYFQITAGPLTLGRRYAHRPPSMSRIDIPVSKYRSVTP